MKRIVKKKKREVNGTKTEENFVRSQQERKYNIEDDRQRTVNGDGTGDMLEEDRTIVTRIVEIVRSGEERQISLKEENYQQVKGK